MLSTGPSLSLSLSPSQTSSSLMLSHRQHTVPQNGLAQQTQVSREEWGGGCGGQRGAGVGVGGVGGVGAEGVRGGRRGRLRLCVARV